MSHALCLLNPLFYRCGTQQNNNNKSLSECMEIHTTKGIFIFLQPKLWRQELNCSFFCFGRSTFLGIRLLVMFISHSLLLFFRSNTNPHASHPLQQTPQNINRSSGQQAMPTVFAFPRLAGKLPVLR